MMPNAGYDGPPHPSAICYLLFAIRSALIALRSGLAYKPSMVKIEIEYKGQLQTEAIHTPSDSRILTDAPVDNGGKGSTFSPTDLVATALGTCMVTIMGMFAERHGIDLTGTNVSVAKEMLQEPVRRIRRLTVEITVPLPATHPNKSALEKAALACPVHESLHPDVEIPVHFHWTGNGERE
jgi:putative redox protein